jgi:hypothetical protein
MRPNALYYRYKTKGVHYEHWNISISSTYHGNLRFGTITGRKILTTKGWAWFCVDWHDDAAMYRD